MLVSLLKKCSDIASVISFNLYSRPVRPILQMKKLRIIDFKYLA